MARKQTTEIKPGESKASTLARIKNSLNIDIYELPKDDVIEAIPTPSRWLNDKIGGGFAKGYFTLLNGMQSSGKTTLVLQTIAYNQKINPDFRVLFIDAEHAFKVQYAIKLGVDMSKVDVARTLDMDDIYSTLYASCCDLDKFTLTDKTKNTYFQNYDLIVIDSIDAMMVEADLQNDSMISNRMGLKASGMSNGIKKALTAVNRTKTAVVMINQFRENIGGYGAPTTTPGGTAKEYYAFVRIDMVGTTAIKTGEEQIGNDVKVTVYKNKNGMPKGKTIWKMFYGDGFKFMSEVLTDALTKGAIIKAGSWYKFLDKDENGELTQVSLAQGEIAMLNLLEDNLELIEKIDNFV